MTDLASTGPVRDGTCFVYRLGPLTMTIDASLGARITEFSHRDRNVLLDRSVVAGTDNQNNFGATFWPSPQASWGWPPLTAIDSDPCEVVVDSEGGVSFTSASGVLLDGAELALTKRFRPDPKRGAIDVTYTLRNTGKRPVSIAPWQIARVPAGGLTLFELGPGGLGRDDLFTQSRDGIVYYSYDPSVVTREGQKTFADGRGWVAHVHRELILLQTFPDLAPGEAAEGEAEIELYANPGRTYVEIEPQGALVDLEPGQSAPDWTVRWVLRPLEQGLSLPSRQSDLATLVEEMLNETA